MVPVSSIGGNVHRRRRLTLELIFLEVGPGKSGGLEGGDLQGSGGNSVATMQITYLYSLSWKRSDA